MARTSLAHNSIRVLALIGLSVFAVREARAVFAPATPMGAVAINLDCPDSRSGTAESVGESVTECNESYTGFCTACMIAEAKKQFEDRVDLLYDCKTCVYPETGCAPSITSDGFTSAECERVPPWGPIPKDCDGDGTADEWELTIECKTNSYDWSFSCASCDN